MALLEIGRIVAGVLELARALLEELVRVVAIERDARAERVDQREAAMLDAALDQVGQVAHLAGVAARHVRRAAGIASGIGLIGLSTLPVGVLLVFMPLTLVGDTWPVVRP